ncbi:hypothetical protein [Sphingomonas sp. CROZ-RG-20F-R02-07]|uniref:hypothetical protein n=1 Tax=Sphingomonas sp. CROZ-RG-20F-R02-07 TaxID=2914832 RepID=UPI001F570AB1|nr:hypothetical protein [Sphingomonas sp. CROZ-RG-20F-R02-07]
MPFDVVWVASFRTRVTWKEQERGNSQPSGDAEPEGKRLFFARDTLSIRRCGTAHQITPYQY